MISLLELAKSFIDDRFLGSEYNRFDNRGIDQSSRLPALNIYFSESQVLANLTGDRHQNNISTFLVIGVATDHNGRTLLAAVLIGEGKSHQYNLTKLKGCRTRHRMDYPIAYSIVIQTRWWRLWSNVYLYPVDSENR